MKVVFDTNAVIDAVASRSPFYKDAEDSCMIKFITTTTIELKQN